jgi:polyphosphate glucokinase
MMQSIVLGIDIGGSGIKGAPVDIDTGQLLAERYRQPTPHPSLPDAIGDTLADLVKHFDWHGPIGCTFPAVIKYGVAYSAANVDKSWIGTDGAALFREKTGCPVTLLNDGDAAGIAEMRFGAGAGHDGVVLIVTVGTGIGSALFVRGVLVPNTELGHIEIRGKDAEKRASEHAREAKQLGWKEWAVLFNEYLQRLEALFSPDLFIIGGGASRKFDKFAHLLNTRAEIMVAQMLNEAGIVGAALAAKEL